MPPWWQQQFASTDDPSDGDLPQYNAISGRWEPVASSSVGGLPTTGAYAFDPVNTRLIMTGAVAQSVDFLNIRDSNGADLIKITSAGAVKGKDATAGNTNGGSLSILGGAPFGTGQGGTVAITAGTGVGGGGGGNVNLTAGGAGPGASFSGWITIQPGDGGTDDASVPGGTLRLRSGAGGLGGGDGGLIQIHALGAANGNGSGGNIQIYPGSKQGSGTSGAITLEDDQNNVVVKVIDNKLGFYNASPVALQTGVAVTAAGVHAALVNLGLITA